MAQHLTQTVPWSDQGRRESPLAGVKAGKLRSLRGNNSLHSVVGWLLARMFSPSRPRAALTVTIPLPHAIGSGSAR